MVALFLFLKGMMGALAPLGYIYIYIFENTPFPGMVRPIK
jgi:hypothetical protein